MLRRRRQSLVRRTERCERAFQASAKSLPEEPTFQKIKIIFSLLVAIVALSMPWMPLAFAGDVTYAYDTLGRLVGVVDNTIASGQNGVSYSYDTGGNLLSTSPQQATTLVIFSTTPCCTANAQTQVIIYGDGFSTIPSQNTVKFGNVSALVTASTLSTITTSVPSGAGIGLIRVTSPNGAVLSHFYFAGN